MPAWSAFFGGDITAMGKTPRITLVGAAAAPDLVKRLVQGAEEDDRDAAGGVVGLEPPADLVTVHARHVDVQQYEVGREGAGCPQRHLTAPGAAHFVSLLFEHVGE